MEQFSLGVIGTSRKEDERRLPIHPLHFDRVDADLRELIFVEHGYGERAGVEDAEIARLVGGLRTREQLFGECDVVLLPKPTEEDVTELREGQVLWGWPHCVQNETITQLGIDHRLTFIAWEAMNHWSADGAFQVHVFHANNEMAGYCSVIHALQLLGRTGHYGRRLRAVVISFGATGRGSVTALNAFGVSDVTVMTSREVTAVAAPIHTALMGQFERTTEDPTRAVALKSTGPVPLAEFLGEHDIIVNCVFQDTDAPLMFVTNEELGCLKPRSLVVDVSCDEGMGFAWARPTSFQEPMLQVGDGVNYYAVDHSPSYLWNSASWEISEALIPYLRSVLEGPKAWDADQTIHRAIEIRDGVVQNPKILSFQKRSEEYPHPRA